MALNMNLNVLRFKLYSASISLQLSASVPGHRCSLWHLFGYVLVTSTLYQAYKAKINYNVDVDI